MYTPSCPVPNRARDASGDVMCGMGDGGWGMALWESIIPGYVAPVEIGKLRRVWCWCFLARGWNVVRRDEARVR